MMIKGYKKANLMNNENFLLHAHFVTKKEKKNSCIMRLFLRVRAYFAMKLINGKEAFAFVTKARSMIEGIRSFV